MESRGDLALYEYLYRCIRHDIAHGKVEPGQKLPSKRALAKQLGVSLITIEAAYDQLVAEGYIRSRERCGYYACDLAPAAKIEEQGNAQFRTATETSANRRREDHVSNPNGPQPISQMKGTRKAQPDIGRPSIQPLCHPMPVSSRRSTIPSHPARKTPRSMRRCSRISRTARWRPPCSPTPLGRKLSGGRSRTNRRHRSLKPLRQQGHPNCEAPSPTTCDSIAGWTCRPTRSS